MILLLAWGVGLGATPLEPTEPTTIGWVAQSAVAGTWVGQSTTTGTWVGQSTTSGTWKKQSDT